MERYYLDNSKITINWLFNSIANVLNAALHSILIIQEYCSDRKINHETLGSGPSIYT